MSRVLCVGITGGIGAGKTLICEIFFRLGVPVYHSDEKAKWLMANHPGLKQKIIKSFGQKSFQDKNLNRRHLAEHVFNDQVKLDLLNSLVHPVVRADFSAWCKTVAYPYCLKEAALLFETGSYKELDLNILVYAPEPLRVQRVLKRDSFRTEAEVKSILGKQMDEERKKEMADFVVLNDGKTKVLPEVLRLHHLLINSPFSDSPRSKVSIR